uniref:[histone H3]-lysine(4) N-trimethyltransferase n=1 Tax=Strongyloides papillosus TaxID=174720 RepID=A0A0N5BNV5_STREA
MGSTFLNVPTFASENDDNSNKKNSENWSLLNQVYEKIAKNEEEQRNKRKRKYRKSVSDVVDYVAEKTNKNECIINENRKMDTIKKQPEPSTYKNNSVCIKKISNVEEREKKEIEKKGFHDSKNNNDLNNLDIKNSLLHSQHLQQNNCHNFKNIIGDKVKSKQGLQVVIPSKIINKKKIQYDNVNIDSSLSSSSLKSKFSIQCKYDDTVVSTNKCKEEVHTCARLQPYGNYNNNVEEKKIIVSGLKNGKDLMSLPELPISSFKHKRQITNSDILDPEVHGHAISKKAMVETSAYSRYQIMLSEWRHYVRMVKSKVHGFGLVANVDIPENTYIIEYTGEQIRYEIANIREKKYTQSGLGVYFFQIDSDYVVDATFYGSCSRYMNHSCEANCIAHIIDINEKKKIIMISSRDIKKGEELVYDYKFEKEEGSDSRIPCFCGAKKCKKWIN